MPADYVFVVSPQKCGTHLVASLMKELGYKVAGPYGPKREGKVWEMIRAEGPGTCFLLHQMRLHERANFEAIEEWSQTGSPALILNYRDPRDAMCSFVHYLMNSAKETFTRFAPNLVQAAILQSLPDHHARLMHAICDPSFHLMPSYTEFTWLLHHPKVCKVSFERLVGAAGGGSDEAQLDEVNQVMRHVGVERAAAEVAGKIFDRSVRVFRKGQIGSWREEWQADHRAAFNARYRSLLEMYGYSVE
jgi:hypothetical protein